MSSEQKKYLRKIKIRKNIILFSQIIIIIAFVVIWE